MVKTIPVWVCRSGLSLLVCVSLVGCSGSTQADEIGGTVARRSATQPPRSTRTEPSSVPNNTEPSSVPNNFAQTGDEASSASSGIVGTVGGRTYVLSCSAVSEAELADALGVTSTQQGDVEVRAIADLDPSLGVAFKLPGGGCQDPGIPTSRWSLATPLP